MLNRDLRVPIPKSDVLCEHSLTSIRLWTFKDGGSYKARFLALESTLLTYSKENYSSSKSAKVVLSKSIFYVKNRQNFKKKSFKNINLGDHFFCKKHFFWPPIFEPLYFLKSCPICPIFDELVLSIFSKYIGFFWVYWFLAKNLAF